MRNFWLLFHDFSLEMTGKIVIGFDQLVDIRALLKHIGRASIYELIRTDERFLDLTHWSLIGKNWTQNKIRSALPWIRI